MNSDSFRFIYLTQSVFPEENIIWLSSKHSNWLPSVLRTDLSLTFIRSNNYYLLIIILNRNWSRNVWHLELDSVRWRAWYARNHLHALISSLNRSSSLVRPIGVHPVSAWKHLRFGHIRNFHQSTKHEISKRIYESPLNFLLGLPQDDLGGHIDVPIRELFA